MVGRDDSSLNFTLPEFFIWYLFVYFSVYIYPIYLYFYSWISILIYFCLYLSDWSIFLFLDIYLSVYLSVYIYLIYLYFYSWISILSFCLYLSDISIFLFLDIYLSVYQFISHGYILLLFTIIRSVYKKNKISNLKQLILQ